MTPIERVSLEAEAAMARLLLTPGFGLYPEEEKLLKDALEVIRKISRR